MTNCFPRLFVVYGQQYANTTSRLHTILWMMSLVLLMSLIPPLSQNIALAQSGSQPKYEQETVPNGCKDDNGNPVKPLNGEGAWAIILNFNHPPSKAETIACVAVVETMKPEKTVTYDDNFRCQIINNLNEVAVGNGKAGFDGNFWIECPRQMHKTAADVTYDKFYVHAKARFPVAAASYTLIDHSDMHMQVSYAPMDDSDMWDLTLTSRYGKSEFAASRKSEMIPQHRFGLQSTILGGEGTHHINQVAVEEREEVDAFGFDFNEPIRIGGSGSEWILYNLVVDPPEPELD